MIRPLHWALLKKNQKTFALKPRMKRILILALVVSIATVGFAQDKPAKPAKKLAGKESTLPNTKPCAPFTVNLNTGKLNGIKPTASMATVKKKLPCYTGDSEEGGFANCGGGVFYISDDFYFYTFRDYIEIRSRFIGNIQPYVLGLYKSDIKAKLLTADKELDGGRVWLYTKPYGTLRLNFSAEGKCIEIGIHNATIDKVELCQ